MNIFFTACKVLWSQGLAVLKRLGMRLATKLEPFDPRVKLTLTRRDTLQDDGGRELHAEGTVGVNTPERDLTESVQRVSEGEAQQCARDRGGSDESKQCGGEIQKAEEKPVDPTETPLRNILTFFLHPLCLWLPPLLI